MGGAGVNDLDFVCFGWTTRVWSHEMQPHVILHHAASLGVTQGQQVRAHYAILSIDPYGAETRIFLEKWVDIMGIMRWLLVVSCGVKNYEKYLQVPRTR